MDMTPPTVLQRRRRRAASPTASSSGQGAVAKASAAIGFLLLIVSLPTASAFGISHGSRAVHPSGNAAALSPSSSSSLAATPPTSTTAEDGNASSPTTAGNYVAAFDFANPSAIERFERIDDAIMGGISTSAIRRPYGDDADYAVWSGVCRTDGGGFCGTRTLPFKEPIAVPTGKDGVFLDAKLTSDEEPERRVWKLTMRSDPSRGEMGVYQASYDLRKGKEVEGGWTRVEIPFEDFVLVRGPRMIPDAPPINVTYGIHQIGLSLSKFVIGTNTTELENFRDGYFELGIRRIGFYHTKDGDDDVATTTTTEVSPSGNAHSSATDVIPMPETLTPKEVKQKRPLVAKLFLPLLRIVFSERVKRRKSAAKVLKETRGWSTFEAVRRMIVFRAKSSGFVRAAVGVLGVAMGDAARTSVLFAMKLCLFYPLVAVSRAGKFVMKNVLRAGAKKEVPSAER